MLTIVQGSERASDSKSASHASADARQVRADRHVPPDVMRLAGKLGVNGAVFQDSLGLARELVELTLISDMSKVAQASALAVVEDWLRDERRRLPH